jgi:uncharacterized membrane protein (DUF2068 family)
MREHPSQNTIAQVRRERGLVLIIAYKLVKGGLWLVLAVVLVVLIHMGLADRLQGFADQLRHHSRAWTLDLAELLVRASSRRGLWTVFVALLLDGVTSLVEGWALLHGHWWGPWLVVVATGALLPFEVVAIARKPHLVRVVLFVVNLAIVWYLARKAMREHRTRVESREVAPPSSNPDSARPEKLG